MTDDCPEPDNGLDDTAATPAKEVRYTGWERFARQGGVSEEAWEAITASAREGVARATSRMLTPLDQQCVALYEWYSALRRAGFTQDEALDYLVRQK